MIKKIYDMGLSEPIYYFFHVLGYVCVLLFNVQYGKRYKVKPRQAIVTTVIVYSVTYLWIHIQYWVESGFAVFGPNNMVRGFVYIPLFALPVAYMLKLEWKRMCDFIAPCVCISFGISHVGCIFTGCCKGVPSDWGIYNPGAERLLFPVQLCEAFTALMVVWLVVSRAKKQQYRPDGLSFPVMLLCYGSTRFLWEFARDNQKILWGCSSLAFHALFMAFVGLLVIVYIKVWGNRREIIRK